MHSQIAHGQTSQAMDTKKALRDARNAFDFGAYALVIEGLTPAIEPNILIAEPKNLIEAYRFLGLAHFFLGQKKLAKKRFEALIRFRPDHSLDSIDTPPPAVAFFQDIKEELGKEIALKKEALRQQREEEKQAEILRNIRRYRRDVQIRSRLVASLPFGVGQFQNEQPVLGAVFLGTEVAAISISLASYLAVENLRGLDGRFRNADVEQARSFQRIQLVSGAIAIGLIAVGITEALISFKRKKTLREVELPSAAPGATLTPTGLFLNF